MDQQSSPAMDLPTSSPSNAVSATTQQRIFSAFAGALMVSLVGKIINLIQVTPFDVVKNQMQSQVGSASIRRVPNFFCFDPLIVESERKRFNGTIVLNFN